MKVLLLLTLIFLLNQHGNSQIFQDEGLNLPGTWNSFTNPPTNNLALASEFQVSGGRVKKITTGTLRWQTILSVAASGGDIAGGNYNWLFTSGPAGNAFQNKWAGVTVSMNTLQSYSFNTGSDNSITVTNGMWYVVNWRDIGYTGTTAIFMELSEDPASINSVTDNYSSPGNPVTVSITLSDLLASEEKLFVRYTTDNFTTSSVVQASFSSGTTYTAVIPAGGVTGTVNNKYYVLTSTITLSSGESSEYYDMRTIRFSNNGGNNFPLPVELTSFTANVGGKSVVLNWTTATEINNYGFEIERKNAGQSWTKIGFVNGHGNSNSLKEYSYKDKNLAPGKYTYRLRQIDTDGTYEYSPEVEATIIQPKEFTVEQNYPNPFNPETRISFSLPQASQVKVTVFNLLGQEITTLINESREAGQHTIDFNADGLNSGVYLYKIEAGSFVQVKKMILSK